MLEKLREEIGRFSFLGAKEAAVLIKLATIRAYKAGDTIVKEGAMDHNSYVVLKGILRSHVLKSNGDERTVYLASEGMLTASSRTFLDGEPSTETITALEDSWVAVFDRSAFMKQLDGNPNLQKLYSELLKRNLREAIDRIEFHTVLNPKERYEHLMKSHPELVQRVPQMYLASYLGITPVSLSRIRSRVVRSSK